MHQFRIELNFPFLKYHRSNCKYIKVRRVLLSLTIAKISKNRKRRFWFSIWLRSYAINVILKRELRMKVGLRQLWRQVRPLPIDVWTNRFQRMRFSNNFCLNSIESSVNIFGSCGNLWENRSNTKCIDNRWTQVIDFNWCSIAWRD